MALAERRTFVRWAAPAADALCLALFVALGRSSHGVDEGAWWFVVVLWPFLVGWFAMAAATGLYGHHDRRVVRYALTVVGAIAITMALRWTFEGKEAISAFTVVSLAFVTAFTGGWRVIASGLSRRT